jgi:threonine dehydrogenase-like Zn-dependent dehydrogenase
MQLERVFSKNRWHKVNSDLLAKLVLECVFLKAIVYHGPKNIKVENVPEPKVTGAKVLVKFKAGSICGTDLHLYRGDWKIKRGRIVGHDAFGIREDTNERVVMVPMSYCGKCYFCKRGKPLLCEKVKYHGLTKGGFFAENIVLKERNLIPLPPNVTDEEAAMTEPVALAIHTLDLLKPDTDDFTTVIGQGPIGLLMTQIAKLKGCRVIAIDKAEYRLNLAEKLGTDHCINAEREDVPKKVKEITKRGSDIVIEAAGTTRTVEQTPFLVRKAGRVALVGEFEGNLNLEEADEACFFTTYISPLEYPTAIDLIARKKIELRSLVTHRFKMDDFEKAIQTANNPEDKPIKVLISNY